MSLGFSGFVCASCVIKTKTFSSDERASNHRRWIKHRSFCPLPPPSTFIWFRFEYARAKRPTTAITKVRVRRISDIRIKIMMAISNYETFKSFSFANSHLVRIPLDRRLAMMKTFTVSHFIGHRGQNGDWKLIESWSVQPKHEEENKQKLSSCRAERKMHDIIIKLSRFYRLPLHPGKLLRFGRLIKLCRYIFFSILDFPSLASSPWVKFFLFSCFPSHGQNDIEAKFCAFPSRSLCHLFSLLPPHEHFLLRQKFMAFT